MFKTGICKVGIKKVAVIYFAVQKFCVFYRTGKYDKKYRER